MFSTGSWKAEDGITPGFRESEYLNANGYFQFPASDDGSTLYIDGESVINHDGPHGLSEKTGTISLDAGVHDIELRYFERRVDARIFLDWSSNELGRERMQFGQGER